MALTTGGGGGSCGRVGCGWMGGERLEKVERFSRRDCCFFVLFCLVFLFVSSREGKTPSVCWRGKENTRSGRDLWCERQINTEEGEMRNQCTSAESLERR